MAGIQLDIKRVKKRLKAIKSGAKIEDSNDEDEKPKKRQKTDSEESPKKKKKPIVPCRIRPLEKQIATIPKMKMALMMLPMIALADPVSKVTGLTPIRARPIAAAAITVASIELRPSSAQ